MYMRRCPGWGVYQVGLAPASSLQAKAALSREPDPVLFQARRPSARRASSPASTPSRLTGSHGLLTLLSHRGARQRKASELCLSRAVPRSLWAVEKENI